ncbi:hypothetical protein JKP88DRAFT_349668 [Tribonema minus]|uniref:Uncharacterized protein n=1 Tax=Tribonema minus TaxID=303371 RepID=A0A835Z0Q6_9STRA|nr:hypothetical protein JKP88DRAFT_349668 [Tribonema minus]
MEAPDALADAGDDASGAAGTTFSNALMKRLAAQALPQGAALDPDAVSMLNQCCTGFIRAMAGHLQGPKTVTPDAVDALLAEMGFGEYAAAAAAQAESTDETTHRKKKRAKVKYTDEEIAERIAEQEKLCAASWKQMYGD